MFPVFPKCMPRPSAAGGQAINTILNPDFSARERGLPTPFSRDSPCASQREVLTIRSLRLERLTADPANDPVNIGDPDRT